MPGAEQKNGSSDLGISDLLGGLDPGMLGKFASVMGDMNRQPDYRCSLLAALKPWLRPERQSRADEAIKILKILRIWELYRKGGL